MFERDADKKAAMRAQLAAEDLPRWFGFLDKRLADNAKAGFFVGDCLTIADLVIWRLCGWLSGGTLDGIPRDLLDGYARLGGLFQRVDERAEVRAWMADHYGDRS
jgi:glutathione S-transferase